MKPMRFDINDCFFQAKSVDPPVETDGGGTFPQKRKKGRNVLIFVMNTFIVWQHINQIVTDNISENSRFILVCMS